MGSDKDSSSRKGAERQIMNYYESYKKLFNYLYTDDRSPLKYDFIGGTTFCYDGSSDVFFYQMMREYVEEARKEGINPWKNLRFGAKIRNNDWVRNNPRVEFLPVETSPTFEFQVRYNWRCEY